MDGLSLRSRCALLAGRAVGALSRLTGRGAGEQISGRVMLAIQPELLAQLASRRRVIVVSATNGKTTTTAMLAAALGAQGETVLTNHTGANLSSGLASALGHAHGPACAVLEVDERVLTKVFDALRPELLVLGNLTRDQLDRFGEVRSVSGQWRKLCVANPTLPIVANSSDPQIVWAASPADVTWVRCGAGWRGDASTCPACGALLSWSDTFVCTCGFGEPTPAAVLEGDQLSLGDERVTLDVALPGKWNAQNAAMAVVGAHRLGVRSTHAAAAVATIGSVSGRYVTYTLADGRPMQIMLAKNPAGWTEVLSHVAKLDASVVLAVNAHLADGTDPSWLWDVPYELLRGKDVIAAGERAADVAVRLRHALVDCVVEPDPLRAAALTAGPSAQLLASYTQFHQLTRHFERQPS